MDAINHGLMPLWNLSPAAPAALVLLARFASQYLSLLSFLAIAAMFSLNEAWRRTAWQMLLAMGLAWLIARGVHSLWPQPRPVALGIGTQWLTHSASAAFPSRHATVGLAFGLVGLLAAPRRSVGVLCLLSGLLIAWSRVALGVHFPMDVIAGAAIAAACALAVRRLGRWTPAASQPRPAPLLISTGLTMPASTGLEVSVLIPAKDEAGNIGPLVREIAAALGAHYAFEVVLVDDGSSDGTGAEFLHHCRQHGVRAQLLRHARSCGQSTALATAAQHAQGRYLVTLDGDGQNDPADIPALVAQARRLSAAGPDFCIAGYRRQRRDTRWKRLQSRIANAVRRRVLDDGVPDTGCGLKLIPRQTWQRLPCFDHMHRFLPALVQRIDGRIAVLPVNHRQRRSGVSKYTAWNRLWVGIVDMLGVRWLILRSLHPTLSSKEVLGEPTP